MFELDEVIRSQAPPPHLSIRGVCLARPLGALPLADDRAIPHGSLERKGHRQRSAAVVAEHVLVTTDGSESSNRAIPFALAAISACGNPRVTLLRVLTPKSGSPVNALEWAMARAHAEANLEQLAERFPDRDRVTSIVAEGAAADQILHFVLTQDVDLIVIASHGSGEARTWRLGGIARKVVISGATSVLVVPSEPIVSSIRRVLLPLDCSPRAECVLPLATKLAETHDAELALAHVAPRPDAPHRLPPGPRDRELIEELTARNRARAETYLESVRDRLVSRGIRATIELLSDTNPARAVEELASRSTCDLVLLAAHGSGCQHGERYGSTARRLLDSVVKPLWIVQDLPADFSTHPGLLGG